MLSIWLSARYCFAITPKKIETERAKYPEWQGLDHPSDPVVRLLERERDVKFKAQQKEFDFLFSDHEC